MTRKEEILDSVDCDKLLIGNKTAKLLILEVMDEYGKYCAWKSWIFDCTDVTDSVKEAFEDWWFIFKNNDTNTLY